MVEPVSAPRRPAAAPVATSDWPAQAADSIERVVGSVRDKTTGPALTVARGLVYGTFAMIVGAAVLVMVCVAAVRGLDVALPQEVWLPDLILGSLLTLIGLALWSRRSPKS
jgi:hypothetical protein